MREQLLQFGIVVAFGAFCFGCCERMAVNFKLRHDRADLPVYRSDDRSGGLLHRAVNLIVALTLVAVGGGELVYFYFIDTSWPRGMAVAAGIA